MSPSPKWCESREAPLFAALAAAQHAAWLAPEDQRDRVFTERLRQMIGHERAAVVMSAAIAIFGAQREAPAGWKQPPDSAYYYICPGCQRLRRTPHTVPQNGRLKLAVLRDREWLAEQFERGRSQPVIATQLGCAQTLVAYWAEKHGLQTLRSERHADYETRAPALHAQKCGPGAIARELGTTVWQIRRVLKRLGLANHKAGHVYMEREWWVERLVRRGWTVRQCAKDAGIKTHNATYYVTKFGLSHVTAKRICKKGERKPRPRYPALVDPHQLADLLRRHESYAAVARAIGCSPHLVSRYARELLGVGKRHENFVPHSARSWWTERLDCGATTWELAEEAGVSEKTARERLRVFGHELLAQGYRNNTEAERKRRSGVAA